jgi:hypothetical protein
MGLLDSLFQPSTYGGQGGGLLDLLQNSLMQQNSYQPSAGFPQQQPGSGRSFDNATFDPATYAPTQPANTIGVGNYQMPRIGNPDQFQPQQAMTPPNAKPAQGQLPQQAQQQAPQQPDIPLPPALGGSSGGFGAGVRGFFNNAHTGPIGAILGGLGGAMGMQSPAQQNLNAQYQAVRQTLQTSGMSPQEAASKAMLAVMNPEAGKTILQEALTSKEKYQVVSEDPFAGKKYGFVNDRDQTVNGQPINAQGQAAGSSSPLADMEKAKAAGVQGEALYEYLPKQIAPMVKAMIEGRQPLPTGAAMRNPATLALIDAAHSVDPTFDATSWGARAAGAKDFTSGKSSEMVRAANQTLAHVGSLLDSMDNLHNRSVPAWNYVANAANEATGGGQPGAFRTNAHAVAEEMSKVFKGANLSDSEIRHWEQNLSENMSPEQQKAQIAKLSELLHGSLQALEEKRVAAIGPMAAEKAGPVIKPEGQKVLERIDGWLKGNGGSQAASGGIQEGATATNPQTGQKLTFRNGKWQ